MAGELTELRERVIKKLNDDACKLKLQAKSEEAIATLSGDERLESVFHNPEAQEDLRAWESFPAFRAVSIDDQPGSIGIDINDGTVKKVEIVGDQRTLKSVSDCALFINTETVASGNTEFTFKGIGAKDHREVCFALPAAALADPRKFRAELINAFGAQNRVGELTFEMVQKLTQKN
jgi:hypothetical protein